MIRFEHVDLGYGRPVLNDVNCEINTNESVGLVGPNGCGKTTFLRGVLGLLPPLRGTISADRAKRFAYVSQADDLNRLWPLTTREVVSLGARSRRAFGRISAAEE